MLTPIFKGIGDYNSDETRLRTSTYFNAGISIDAFPEDVPSTGFNYNLMQVISDQIALIKTFKLQRVRISSIGTSQTSQKRHYHTRWYIRNPSLLKYEDNSLIKRTSKCGSVLILYLILAHRFRRVTHITTFLG